MRALIYAVIIVMLLIVLAGIGAWIFLIKRDFEQCKNKESVLCPSYTCGTSADDTDGACGAILGKDQAIFYPYRKTSNGVECKSPYHPPVVSLKKSS